MYAKSLFVPLARILFVLVLFPIPFLHAEKEGGGGSDSGGGNDIALVFTSKAKLAIEGFAKSNLPEATPSRIRQLKDKFELLNVSVATEKLTTIGSGCNQIVVAKNFPSENRIVLNGFEWNKITDERVRQSLALHELESLLREEKSCDYHISGKFLASMAYQGGFDTALTLQVPKENQVLPDRISLSNHDGDQFLEIESDLRYEAIDLASGQLLPAFTDHAITHAIAFFDGNIQYYLVDNATLGKKDNVVLFSQQKDIAKQGSALNQVIHSVQMKPFGLSSGRMIKGADIILTQVFDYETPGVIKFSDLSMKRQGLITSEPFQFGFIKKKIYYPYENNGQKIMSYVDMVKYLNKPKRDILNFFPESIRLKVEDFSKAHYDVLKAKGAVQKCNALPNSHCDTLLRALERADQTREELWNGLIRVEDLIHRH